MPVKINTEFEGSQRDLINKISRVIATGAGYEIARDVDVVESMNPRSRHYCRVAEEVFEIFYGDSPDYSDEDELVEPKPLKKFAVFTKKTDLRIAQILPASITSQFGKKSASQYWEDTSLREGESKAEVVEASSAEQAKEIYLANQNNNLRRR
jgi:hypothetical protein